MKKLLTVLFIILSPSTAQAAETTKKAPLQGLAVALKTSKPTIITQLQIQERKHKQLLKNIQALPEELQQEILFYTILKQLKEGIIDFATLTPLKARRFAQRIERLLHQASPEKAHMIIQELVAKNQLIGFFLDEIDYNKLPEQLRATIDIGVDNEIDAIIEEKNFFKQEKRLHSILGSIKKPQLLDTFITKYLSRKSASGISYLAEYAAEHNVHPQIIEYFVKERKIPSQILFNAAVRQNKNPEVLIRLKELGAMVRPVDLCDAIIHNRNKKIITTLLSFGLEQSARSCPGSGGNTPLQQAVAFRNATAVEELINGGADVNTQKYGTTLLMQLFYNYYFSIEYFDREFNQKKEYPLINQVEEIARLLLEHGASTKGARDIIEQYFSNDPALKDKFLALIKPYEKKSIWQFWR